MKKTSRKNLPRALYYIITILLINKSLQNSKCVVDQCKRCRYINIDTCDECESGYYLRTWHGSDKNRDYNACWSIMKLLFTLLGTLLLTLSYLYCCYRAYKKGKNITKIVTEKKDKKVIKDERKISKGSKYKDQRDIPSTSRPINIETQPNEPAPINVPNTQMAPGNPIHVPNMAQPAQNTPVIVPPPGQQVNPAPMQVNPIVVGNVSPSPQRVVRQPVYSPNHSYHDEPSRYYGDNPVTTIIRERPTTIIREVNNGDYQGLRKVKRRNPKKKRSARVIRYEPDSIREINRNASRSRRRRGY